MVTLCCKFPRLSLFAAMLLIAQLVAAQPQQKFPAKPIRLIVAFTAGGTSDILARVVAPAMNEAFGHPIMIEPRASMRSTSVSRGRLNSSLKSSPTVCNSVAPG